MPKKPQIMLSVRWSWKILDTQSAQILQKEEDEHNIYAIMKTMCPPIHIFIYLFIYAFVYLFIIYLFFNVNKILLAVVNNNFFII